MSTEIQPGKMPVNITTNTSRKNAHASHQKPVDDSASSTEPRALADTVSITDKVSRLQEIEKQLATIPAVNDTLVSEIKQTMAAGELEVDLGRIASKLIEIETGSIPTDKK